MSSSSIEKSHKISDLLMVIGIGILYIGILNDILVINQVYTYYYLLEYAYLFTVIVMGVSLSQIIYEGLNAKNELVSNNIDLQRIKTYQERSVQESVAETINQKRYFEALVEYSPLAIVSLFLNFHFLSAIRFLTG